MKVKMKVKAFNNNDMGQNNYLYYDENGGEGFLIDAGCSDADISELEAFVTENNIYVVAILLTHGHYDHIIGVHKVKQVTSADVYCHEAEKDTLESAKLNHSAMFGIGVEVTPDCTFIDGDALYLHDEAAIFKVLHTPGHTPGSVCFYDEANGNLFSGDTLFKGTVGRTDLPRGSHADLIKNLKEKLLTLPDDTEVYPGHGESTTIGYEKRYNPFAT